MNTTQRKHHCVIGWRAPVLGGVCLVALISFGWTWALAQPPEAESAPAPTNSVAVKAKVPEAKKPLLKRQITGAELYSINCNRCHQERYPTERTGAQWKTIMLHMQARANIPAKQAKLILQYLQENSGR
ncbi:MAG: hypothetical protein KGJ60_05550 [Verrucomicrobiota bacterium]|nr:hypothetical protein [Verrucomicrobiota bacterium]